MPTASREAAYKFEALDGLRALAALVIVNFHMRGAFSGLLPQAYLAVDFFFVLSGFVIAHAYEARLREGLGFVEFMARRYIRLWPLYVLALAIAVPFEMLNHPSRGALAVYAALGLVFLPQGLYVLTPFGAAALVAPSWSLSMELAANAIYAAIARFLTTKILALVLVASALFLTGVWVHSEGTVAVGQDDWQFVEGMSRVLWSFFAGVAVYRLWVRWPSFKLPLALPACALILMFLFPLDLAWALVGCPAVVYVAAGAQPAGWTRTLCLRLGSASYAIYILHWPITYAVRLFTPMTPPWVTFAVAGFVILISIVLDSVYDQPARAWLTRMIIPGVRKIWPAITRPAVPAAERS